MSTNLLRTTSTPTILRTLSTRRTTAVLRHHRCCPSEPVRCRAAGPILSVRDTNGAVTTAASTPAWSQCNLHPVRKHTMICSEINISNRHISALASLQGMVLMDFKMNWSSREVWVTQLDAYSELWVHLAILILCIDFLLLSAGLVGAAQAAVVRRERLAFRWTRRSSAGWVSINQWLNTDSPLNVVWSNNKNS